VHGDKLQMPNLLQNFNLTKMKCINFQMANNTVLTGTNTYFFPYRKSNNFYLSRP